MTDFYNNGRLIGLELGAKTGEVTHKAAGFVTADENLAWVNGMIDGVIESGATVKGIRISSEISHQLRNAPLAGPNDTYREIRFVEDLQLYPESAIQIVV